MRIRTRRNIRSNRGSRKTQLGWVGSSFSGAATDIDTVTAVQLVGATDFLVSPAGEAYVNIKRIVGEVFLGFSDAFINGAAANFRAGVAWAIFIQDLSDTAVLSPDDSTNMTNEVVLAHGVVPLNGSLNALTGAGYNTYIPSIRFDVKSNRRCTELQECYFATTVFTGANLNVDGEGTIVFGGMIRALITTGVKTL